MSDLKRFFQLLRRFKGVLSVNLVSYADESGTHDATGVLTGAEVCGVCGYIATEAQWIDFGKAWDAILGSEGIGEFHTAEFADRINGPKNPAWPYFGWSEPRRKAFIEQLISAAREYPWFAVGGIIKVQAYHAIVPQRIKDIMQHPYQFCFQLFLERLAKFVDHHSGHLQIKDGEKIDFFFEQQREMEDRAHQTFGVLRNRREIFPRFGALTFVGKEYLPLQAADLLAYVMRQSHSRKLVKGDWSIQPKGWEDQLISRQNVDIAYYDEENLPKLLTEMGYK